MRTSSRRAWRRSSKPNPNPDPNPNPNPNPNPDPDPDPDQVIKTFRQRGTGGDALFVKIDHGKDELQLEDNLHGTTVDAARWKAQAPLAMRQRAAPVSWGWHSWGWGCRRLAVRWKRPGPIGRAAVRP